MATYADGSALARALATDPESVSWLRWSSAAAAELVTSPLGVSELRRAGLGRDAVARAKVHAIATTISVVRFSDEALGEAALVADRLDPFRALHLGVVVAERGIDTLATYDAELARAADLHEVAVVTPGRPERWWMG